MAIKPSIKHIVDVLGEELERINNTLAEVVAQNEHYAHKKALLQSVKGIGQVVATSLLADLPELGQLSAKQVSALAGLAPFNRDSGTLRGKRTVWGGRASVRRTYIWRP